MRNSTPHRLFSSEASTPIHSGVANSPAASLRPRISIAKESILGVPTIGKKVDCPWEASLSRPSYQRVIGHPDDRSAFDRKQRPEIATSFEPRVATRNCLHVGHCFRPNGTDSSTSERTKESQKEQQPRTCANCTANRTTAEQVSTGERSVSNYLSEQSQHDKCKCADASSTDQDFKLVSRSTTTQNQQQSQTSLDSASPTPSPTKIQQRFALHLTQLAHTGNRYDCQDELFAPLLPVRDPRRPAGKACLVRLSPGTPTSSLLTQASATPGVPSPVDGKDFGTAFLNGKYKVFYRHLKRLSTNSQLRCNRMLAGQDLVLRS